MPDFMPVCKQDFMLGCKSEMRTAKKIIVHQIKRGGINTAVFLWGDTL